MAAARPTVLIAESERFSAEALERVRSVGNVTLADLDRPGLLAAVGSATVLWVRLRNRFDMEIFAAGPRLRAVVTPTTGLNHIDLSEASRRGIDVLSLRGEADFLRDVRATAEHTLALILALVRRLPAAAGHVKDGGWDRDAFRGYELHRKTAGVVGYGRLGRIVARYLRAFDMDVLAADPTAEDLESGVRLVSLPELLAQSDVVTLHVNLTPATAGFFGRGEFESMKSGAWFVNTSRGELVDESALHDHLSSGRLAGAALDVLADERATGMTGHPLVAYARQHENLLITPHIGGCTVESMHKTELFMAEKLCRWLGGHGGAR